jgi:hypothetical protein
MTDISGRKIMFYLVAVLVITASFFLIVWFVSTGKTQISEITPGLENYLIIQRFLSSPSCFVFEEEQIKAHPLVLDPKKFNQNNLDKCYNAENTKVKAYNLRLKYGTEEKSLATRNWEGFLKKSETKRIYVYDEGRIIRGELIIEMQDAK